MSLDRWGFPLPAERGRRAPSLLQERPKISSRGPGSAAELRLLADLRRLCAEPRSGVPLSARHIARITGKSKQHILNIERSGLKKLRLRLPPEIRIEFEALLSSARKLAIAKNTCPKN